jgi:hypothetical protein
MSEIINTEKLLLDSVNILLKAINQLPIETEADYDVLIEARLARDTLIEVKRAVLSEGWDFNTDKNYLLPIDNQGMIPVPSNVLDLQAVAGNNLIIRDWRLYDKDRQSFVFDEAQKVNIIWDMDFNSLTHPIRHYITIRAARIFISRTIGDTTAVGFTQLDEEDAYLACRRSESRTNKYNMFRSPFGVNNRIRMI